MALLLSLAACGSDLRPVAPPTDGADAPVASAVASGTLASASAPVSLLPNPSAVPIAVPAAIGTIVNAPDRSDDDKALDQGRHPGELLGFFGVSAGMKVAELGAGGGYTTELLARAVGSTGTVYGQNSPFILKRFAEKPWSTRLAKPVMKNVVRLDRAFDDPFGAGVGDLDAVFIVLFYHDTVWQKVDREKMNAAVFRALKSGGIYAVVDHSARAGSGTSETDTFHRIEESTVKDEIGRAGFRLDAEAYFLRNPLDTRDWNDSPKAAGDRRGTSDRFVLKFVKP